MPRKTKAQLISELVQQGHDVPTLEGKTNAQLSHLLRSGGRGFFSNTRNRNLKGGCAGKAKCGCKGDGILNKAINSLPVELHMIDQDRKGKVRKAQFAGPGTKLKKRLDKNDQPHEWSTPINDLDAGAYEHDLCYRDNKSTKVRNTKCDPPFRAIAQSVLDDPDATLIQKANATIAKKAMEMKERFGMGVHFEALSLGDQMRRQGIHDDELDKAMNTLMRDERSGSGLQGGAIPAIALAAAKVLGPIIASQVAKSGIKAMEADTPGRRKIQSRLDYLRNKHSRPYGGGLSGNFLNYSGSGVTLIGDGTSLIGSGATLIGEGTSLIGSGAAEDFWSGFQYGFTNPVEGVELVFREVADKRLSRGRQRNSDTTLLR